MFHRPERAGQAILEGVISFYGSFYTLRAESVLKKAGFIVRLIPGPRAISPNCGVALRFDYGQREQAAAELERSSVQYEAIHHDPAEQGSTPGSRGRG